MPHSHRTRLLATAIAAGSVFSASEPAQAATYIFAGASAPDVITHAKGYTGAGGALEISVGIDQTSLFASEMQISVQNVVNTWNGLLPTVGNLQSGLVPSGAFDFESVLLHEMGHALGLDHTNLASESGESGSNRDFAPAGRGANGVFDLSAGSDGVIGTADDDRGDDVNLGYFRIGENDPFATDLGIVDSTTYSRNLGDLPRGQSFGTSGGRDAAAALGYAQTEAVMQQGSLQGEAQRSLTADDVAGLLYARSGVDELAGTADDYTVTLNFIGAVAGADILIDFDNTQASFAVSQSQGVMIADGHTAITQNSIYFNTGYNWFFNDQSNVVDVSAAPSMSAVPLPGAFWAMIVGLAGFGGVSMRGKKRAA